MTLQLRTHSYWEGIDTKQEDHDKYNIEYFYSFGNKIVSTNNNTTVTNTEISIIDGWNSAYGKIAITPRKNKQYFWAIIIKEHHLKYSSIVVGIEEIKTGLKHIDTHFHGQEETVNYGYKSNGKKYSNLCPSGQNFADTYNANDIVFMLIEGYSLSFCKLSEKFCKKKKIKSIDEYIQYGTWITAEKRIKPNIKYKMAVSLYGKTMLFGKENHDQSSVELLQYQLRTLDVSDSDEKDDWEEQTKMEDTLGLKNKLVFLEKELEHFENGYDNNTLRKAFNKEHESLMVMDDINALKKRLKSFKKHLGRIEHYIQSVNRADVTKYETWNIPQMIQWIGLLDGGAYCKYLKVLRNGFESDNICTGEVLCELTMDNLRNQPFNIKDFMVRNKLVQHFQALKKNNQAYI